jgi:hypothetical protein
MGIIGQHRAAGLTYYIRRHRRLSRLHVPEVIGMSIELFLLALLLLFAAPRWSVHHEPWHQPWR